MGNVFGDVWVSLGHVCDIVGGMSGASLGHLWYMVGGCLGDVFQDGWCILGAYSGMFGERLDVFEHVRHSKTLKQTNARSEAVAGCLGWRAPQLQRVRAISSESSDCFTVISGDSTMIVHPSVSVAPFEKICSPRPHSGEISGSIGKIQITM